MDEKKNDMKRFWTSLCVSLTLVLVGLMLSVICLTETNSTSLLVYHDGGAYTSYIPGPLIPNQTIRGEFQAAYDNLGMVKLRVRTLNRINTTHISFDIREKGNGTPLASNTYTIDRFADGLLYPFGFPVISNSRGKIYEYTLRSSDGTTDNAIDLVSGYHNVATQYVFQKSSVLAGSNELLTFISEKVKSTLTDPYTILYGSIFLIPAILYCVKSYGEFLLIYTFLVYTYIPLSLHSNTILYIAALTAAGALFLRTHSSRIYLVAFIWSVQIPVLVALRNILSADRAATLIFFFILIGGIISLTELKKK
jgi:hypothetical protein